MSWLWWLIGTLGVGGTVLALAIFFLGWPAIIGTRAGRMLLIIGTAGLGAVALYLKGRSVGREAERAKLKAKIGKEVVNAKKERDRINNLTDEEVDRELAKWDR
jgi:dephospho-CoA kinase